MVDFIVAAGQTVIISEPISNFYDNFIMNDNSKIITKLNIHINALRAEFGQNCIIDGSGANGPNGADNTYIPAQVTYCDSGYKGQNAPRKSGRTWTRHQHTSGSQ